QLSLSADGIGAGQSVFEERTVDGVVYVHLPSLSNRLAGGRPWMALGLPADATGGGMTSSPFGLAGSTDPTQVIGFLEKVSDDVKLVGPETIRGVDTTHYSATVDFAKVVDRANVPSGMRDTIMQFSGLFGNVPVDVWIDGDGRLRQE